MKKLLVLLTLFTASLALAACQKQAAFDFESGVLVVGMECDYPPFNWSATASNDYSVQIDGSNLFCDGYDVAVAHELANELGLTLVVKQVSWEGLIPALNTGVIDAIIAGMSPTSDRQRSVSFTEGYYRSTHVILLKSDSEYATATSINDFNQARAVAQFGTVYDDLIEQLVGANHLPAMDTIPTIVGALNAGTADITIVEKPVALGIVASHPSLTFIELTEGFDVLEEDVLVSIAVRKNDTALKEALDVALLTISESTRDQWMLDAINRQGE